MLSALDLGILALAAYSDLPAVSGWSLNQRVKDGPFFAAHLVSKCGVHAIAVRGSEMEWRDWLQDDLAIVVRSFPPQCRSMADFLVRVRAAAGFERIWLTGHSLGGYLAGYAAALTGFPVVTFNAPGRVWPNAMRDLTDTQRSLHIRAARDFLTMPTPDLPGRVLKLDVPGSRITRTAFCAATAISSSGFSMLVRAAGAVAEIHHQHSMETLLDAVSDQYDLTIPLPW